MKLEVGPGCGDYKFRPYYEPSIDVVYLDVRRPSVKVGASWVVGDANRMPFRDFAFSEVSAVHVLEHFNGPSRFIGECKRILVDGGKIYLETPNFLSKNAYSDPDHKHVFNFASLWRLMKKAGFKPHYPAPNIASLLPRSLRRLIKAILLFICDTLVIWGEKL